MNRESPELRFVLALERIADNMSKLVIVTERLALATERDALANEGHLANAARYVAAADAQVAVARSLGAVRDHDGAVVELVRDDEAHGHCDCGASHADDAPCPPTECTYPTPSDTSDGGVA